MPLKVVLARVAWSYEGWCGWDERMARLLLAQGRRPLALEWWNFYEGFHPDYYYGYFPPLGPRYFSSKTLRSRLLVFLVSFNPYARPPERIRSDVKLIGFYAGAEAHPSSRAGFNLGISLWETLPGRARRLLEQLAQGNPLVRSAVETLRRARRLPLRAPKRTSARLSSYPRLNWSRIGRGPLYQGWAYLKSTYQVDCLLKLVEESDLQAYEKLRQGIEESRGLIVDQALDHMSLSL